MSEESGDERDARARRHARYTLGILTLVYAFNFIDRQILSILLEPVKRELGASDSAMGLLTGVTFAAFYAGAGIPIARWADRGVRRDIVVLGLALWSAMTALSGLARTFTHLALARVGVGIGEAACTPPSHSMIADLFPPERRATAMAVYSTGIHAGILAGFVIGGWMAQLYGWRAAFFAVGLPGLLLALVMRFTVREPVRGSAEAHAGDATQRSFAAVFRELWSLRAFRWLSAAAAVTSITGYAFTTWSPAFLARVHGLSSGTIGTGLGLIHGLGGAAGTLAGGWLTDRLGRIDARWQMWVPALGASLAAPLFALYAAQEQATVALLVLLPATVFHGFWFAPVFSLAQGLAPLRARAVASSVLLFIINIVGLGLGPYLVGTLNDALAPSAGEGAIRFSLIGVAIFDLAAAALFLFAARALGASATPPFSPPPESVRIRP